MASVGNQPVCVAGGKLLAIRATIELPERRRPPGTRISCWIRCLSRTEPVAAEQNDGRGVLYGASAYGMWGVFPLFFHILAPANAIEILAHRIVWSMLFCALLWIVIKDRSWIRALIAVPHHLVLLIVAALVLSVNWGGYIYAVTVHNVVESSLGYFINPMVLVLMGVILLHERLRPLQWVAMGIGLAAVLVVAIGASTKVSVVMLARAPTWTPMLFLINP